MEIFWYTLVTKKKGDIPMRKHLYQNKECGNILTYDEMIAEFKEMYDGCDSTNPVSWTEYYEIFKW